MFRRTALALGSYITNQRVVVDWWQPHYREDVHQQATHRLKEVLGRVQERRDLQHAQDDAPLPAAETEMEPAYLDEDGMMEGHAHAADEGSTRKTPTDAPRAEMLLLEANALVSTFTAHKNSEDLSAVLQYIREVMMEELSPYHYHSLLRIFNHERNKDNAMQLLEVMAQREELTQETYARVVDLLHCLAPPDALQRMLEVCHLCQDAHDGSLLLEEVMGSESSTVAAFGSGEAHRAALADAGSMPTCSSTSSSAPVLTSLLHHVANGRTGGDATISAFVIVAWMRCIGVERLGDWDLVFVLHVLITRVEDFPLWRSIFGSFAECKEGYITPQALMDRLERRGLLASSSSLRAVVGAMRRSLARASVDVSAEVQVGLMNLQTSSLEEVVERILSYAESGLGPHHYNPAALHHVLSLTHSLLRDDTEAVQVLRRAAEAIQRKAGASSSSTTTSDEGEVFAVHHHHLMDMGSVLAKVSQRSLRDCGDAFVHLVQRVGLTANEHKLRELDPSNAELASGLSATALRCLGGPSTTATQGDCELCESTTLAFIRTNEEARKALQCCIASLDNTRLNQSRTSRALFTRFAEFCCRHPPTNAKLTANGLAERRKWGSYLDARDTALTLFGSAQQARDAMKHMYYHENQLPHLRSADVVERDVADVSAIFFPEARGDGVAKMMVDELPQGRTSLPYLRCSPHAVPPHLFDESVYNPYPHCRISTSPADAEHITEDFFADLWRTMMNRSVMGPDQWYVQNPEMYLLLMRGLLYRLDWEAAAHLTSRMLEHTTFTYMMDHQLTLIFRDIGDPAGALAFKVATKLFDGRIVRDGQANRTAFHQDQLASTS